MACWRARKPERLKKEGEKVCVVGKLMEIGLHRCGVDMNLELC